MNVIDVSVPSVWNSLPAGIQKPKQKKIIKLDRKVFSALRVIFDTSTGIANTFKHYC